VVRALRVEAYLTAAGEQAIRAQIVGLRSQRLQIEDWYRRHPEIEDEPIAAPLFGVSLPRTGSTALAFLLAKDPNARSLRAWEASEPCPPPATVEGPDPRIERAEWAEKMQREHSPRLAALVPSSATGPRDCQLLLGFDFKAPLFYAFACIPSYAQWLLHDADLESAYFYMRRALKLLQWGAPTKPWHLESPANLQFINALDAVFPDARFVMTHREPTQVIVSGADVNLEVVQMFNDVIDSEYIGELTTEYWSVGIDRTIAFRDRGCDDRFYDIDFRPMQRDPIGEVRRLYAWLGTSVAPEFEAGMRSWWAENSENREPNIHPDPSIFGLDLDRIRSCFAAYTSRLPGWTARG
jgi:Sulfotransferase family